MKIVNPNKHNLSKEKLQFMDELFMDRYISSGKISGTVSYTHLRAHETR